jgi:hypothetical protein
VQAELYSGQAYWWWRRQRDGALGWRLCGQPIAAWRPEFYGPSGQMGPSVLQMLCLVNDCLSAVEVGSLCLAARLMFIALTISCASAVQVVG